MIVYRKFKFFSVMEDKVSENGHIESQWKLLDRGL